MIDVPVLVKDALRDGRLKKNYRFIVLDSDGDPDFTIDNNNLVSESVKFDERMCSGDTIRFGLCEGSSLEFQYFDKANITDRRLQAFIDVQYVGTGYENVQKFQRYSFITLEEGGNYRAYSANANGFSKLYLLRNGSTQQLTPTSTDTETYVEFSGMVGDMLEVEWTQFPLYDTYLQKQTSDMLLEYPIPMGFFTVKNCSRQASTGIIKATAYNLLMSEYLDQKANDLLLEGADDFDLVDGSISFYSMLYNTLRDYSIRVYGKNEVIPSYYSWAQTSLGIVSPDTSVRVTQNPNDTSSYNTLNIWFGADVFIDYGFDDSEYYEFQYFSEFMDEVIHYLFDVLNNGSYSYLKDYYIYGTDQKVSDYFKANAFSIMKSQLVLYLDTSDPNPYKRLFELNGDNQSSKPITKILGMQMSFPQYVSVFESTKDFSVIRELNEAYFKPLLNNGELKLCKVEILDGVSEMDKVRLTVNQVENLPNVTLRELQSAVYETVCQFGQLSRITNLFSGVELNRSRLLPQIDLYPDTGLYPSGAQSSSFKSMYSKLWADEGNVQKWRNLIITYKGLDENNQEKEFTLQRQVNADGTQDYNCSDNWIFKNLVWTSAQIESYADAMVSKMQDVTWFPFEMWAAGLPYLEPGDEIEISIGQTTYISYILQRQLQGIQNLQDTYINGTLDIF